MGNTSSEDDLDPSFGPERTSDEGEQSTRGLSVSLRGPRGTGVQGVRSKVFQARDPQGGMVLTPETRPPFINIKLIPVSNSTNKLIISLA